jgi:Ran GTPase-activating protein (RanGAP) involved in mRNA processing and transport
MLNQNFSLEYLSMNGCSIGDEGAIALAEGFAKNQNLRVLKIRNNKVKADGAEAIGISIASGELQIIDLDLSFNLIRDRGAIAVFEGLGNNITLEKLDVADNLITNMGALKADFVLKKRNKTLVKLMLKLNAISVRIVNAIKISLIRNKLYNKGLEKPRYRQEINRLEDDKYKLA